MEGRGGGTGSHDERGVGQKGRERGRTMRERVRAAGEVNVLAPVRVCGTVRVARVKEEEVMLGRVRICGKRRS